MPRSDGPENLRISKKESVEIGPWRQRVEFLPLRHRVEFSTVEHVVGFFGSLPTEIINITRCAARQHSGVIIVRLA